MGKQIAKDTIEQLNTDIKNTDIKKEVYNQIKKPNQFNVLLLNDDYTTMEFVVSVLIRFFNKKVDDAYKLMSEVHDNGKSIAGTYSKDIAETKCRQVTESAKQHEFPLRCVVEKNNF